MASITEMREERARIFHQAKALNEQILEDQRDFSAEEQEVWDRMNAEMDNLAQKISETEKEERLDAVRKSLEEKQPSQVTRPRTPNEEFLDEFRSFLRGEKRRIEITYTASDVAKDEQRDLLAGSGTGANVVPTSFVRRLTEHLIENSAVRQANPQVLTTSSGEALTVPKTTAHPTGALVAEGAAITENDPTFATVTLNAFKYGNLAQLSREFVQDEAINVLEYLARQNGVALGNITGQHFITGTGTSQPRGVATAAATGKTGAAGQTTSVTGDDLIDLQHSIVSGYRRRAFWLMRDATAAAVRKLKDGNSQYLWQPGLQAGQPDLLLGRPVVTDPNVATMAASAKSILYGDFSGYVIRDVGSVAFERSDDFAFNTDLITFRAIIRTDGDLVDENAVKAYVNSAT